MGKIICCQKCNGPLREVDLLALNLSAIVSCHGFSKWHFSFARHDGIITNTIINLKIYVKEDEWKEKDGQTEARC